MTKREIFIENLFLASGAAGMKKNELYKNLQTLTDVELFMYMIEKAYEHYGKEWLNCHTLINDEIKEQWTEWHHVEEVYSEKWGFDKKQSGCYIYGLFDKQPIGVANPLDKNIFYIGESRSKTRSAMLARRGDFRSTVKNDPLQPYGVGVAFKKTFGIEQYEKVYQAYCPMPVHKCKEKETELLVNFFKTYGKLPTCNNERDFKRVQNLSTNLINFVNNDY